MGESISKKAGIAQKKNLFFGRTGNSQWINHCIRVVANQDSGLIEVETLGMKEGAVLVKDIEHRPCECFCKGVEYFEK